MKLKTCLHTSLAIFFAIGCTRSDSANGSQDEEQTTFDYVTLGNSQASASGKAPVVQVTPCYLAQNTSSLVKVTVLEDVKLHPASCEPIPYAKSHYTIGVRVDEVMGGTGIQGELEVVLVDSEFMVYPIRAGDQLLMALREARGTHFLHTHALLMPDGELVEEDRFAYIDYQLALPPFMQLREDMPPLFDDAHYLATCSEQRMTVNDEDFAREKHTRIEECSPDNPVEDPADSEQNPAIDPPGN